MTKRELMKMLENVPDGATVSVAKDGAVYALSCRRGGLILRKGEERSATHVVLLGEFG